MRGRLADETPEGMQKRDSSPHVQLFEQRPVQYVSCKVGKCLLLKLFYFLPNCSLHLSESCQHQSQFTQIDHHQTYPDVSLSPPISLVVKIQETLSFT